jgi:hypothetical protein
MTPYQLSVTVDQASSTALTLGKYSLYIGALKNKDDIPSEGDDWKSYLVNSFASK